MAGWCLWMALGILIVIIGFTGALGKIIAVTFAPGILEWNIPVPGSSGAAGGGSSSAG